MLNTVSGVKIISPIAGDAAKKALVSYLQDVPFLRVGQVQAVWATDEVELDFGVRVDTPSGACLLVVCYKANGQPRWARVAVNQILRYTEAFPGTHGVFVAPYISPQAAEICARWSAP